MAENQKQSETANNGLKTCDGAAENKGFVNWGILITTS